MKVREIKIGFIVALLLTCSLSLRAQVTSSSEKTDADRNRPAGPTYRLKYTLTESEGAKQVGVQHFALTLTNGGHEPYATMKLGSRTPVATGGTSGSPSIQTQFTYLDVGLNISASLREYPNGQVVETKVEQSGFVQPTAQAGQPIIRQTVLQNTALLTLGKPVVLGSLDTPGSTHHLDIEVTLELVR